MTGILAASVRAWQIYYDAPAQSSILFTFDFETRQGINGRRLLPPGTGARSGLGRIQPGFGPGPGAMGTATRLQRLERDFFTSRRVSLCQ